MGGGGTHVMHGRGRMNHRPLHPCAMPGRGTSGFNRLCRHFLHEARSAVRPSASRVGGKLHPTQNRFLGGFSCIWTTASNESTFFLVSPLPGTVMGILCNCLMGVLPYTWYTLLVRVRSVPLCRGRVHHLA